MTTVALVLGALIAVAAVFFVARPFLREPLPKTDRLDEPSERERQRLELEEGRDRALAALKELEFDHRTGKVSEEDYRALVVPLRQRAAETLKALDEGRGDRGAAEPSPDGPPLGDRDGSRAPARARRSRGG